MRGRSGRWVMPSFTVGTAIIVSMQFMVVGLVPTLAEQWHIPLQQVAWLVTGFSLSAGLIGPVLTSVFGRARPGAALPLILVLFGLSGLVAAALPSYPVMLIIRLCQGALLTPFFSIASATAAALAQHQRGRAGKAVGRVTLGTIVGSVLGVPVALALAHSYDWQTVFAGLGVLALGAAGCTVATVPRLFRPSPVRSRSTKALRSTYFVAHLVLSVLVFTAMFAAYTYIASFLEDVLYMSPNVAAIALLGFGLAGVVGNWAAAQVVDRNPLRATMVVIAVLVMVTVLLPLALRHWLLIALTLALWGFVHNAAFVVNLVRAIFAAGDAPALGAALAVSAANVGMATGALWGGIVVGRVGIRWIGLGTVTAGLLALVVGWLLMRSAAQG